MSKRYVTVRDGGDGVLYHVWLVRLSSLSSPASRMGRKITGGMVEWLDLRID